MLLWGSTAAASTVVIGPVIPGAGVSAAPPASFVIAAKGIRHSFNPLYSRGGLTIIGPAPVTYQYVSELENGPHGMTVSQNGVLDWTPALAEIGTTESFTVRFRVSENGSEIFAATRTYSMKVTADLPQMLEPALQTRHEQVPQGWSSISFSEAGVTDETRKLFNWSLIGAPSGVTIDNSGGIHWPDDRGYAREEPYVFKVRIDYATPNGSVFDEVTYSRRVLPRPATNDYSELRIATTAPQSGGMLGFSTAAGDGWIAAGEPFPAPGAINAGRVHLWKKSTTGDSYAPVAALQPAGAINGLAFGASVSISQKTPSHPTRLAIGAPGALGQTVPGEIQNAVGVVLIYACDAAGNWNQEARLDPPVPIQASLYFGGWVSILGDTLIVSIEGERTAGAQTGALAVFQHNGTSWVFSQLLQVPIPTAGDFFSYPADLSGEWIAAAANEDDDHGNNTGAVHLFQKQGSQYVHRQELHAPVPEAGALFGERLIIEGSWLFISSFRESGNRGAVQVFKLSGGTWSYHQTLSSPFAGPGSAFGVGLAHSEDLLTVSAPGHLMGDPSINGLTYQWRGITQFRLEDDAWKWLRHVAESPDSSIRENTWGYSLAQLTPSLTVASTPDMQLYNSSQPLPFAGRLFIHRWPALFADPFTSALAALPPVNGAPATATGDANQNGVPNLIDWLIGQDPGAGLSFWDARVPLGKKPFVRIDPSSQGLRFMVPKLRAGLRHRMGIEISHDLIQWQVVPNARWGALEDVYFPQSDGSRALTNFHPVFIPADAATLQRPIFVRLGAQE